MLAEGISGSGDVVNDEKNAEPLDAHKVHKLRAKRDTGDEIDPVYKKLSAINGEINRMTSKELRDKLAELKLDIRGSKDILQKRLKMHYKQRKLMKAKVRPPGNTTYDYLIVIDFEATCQENNLNYNHEIIEFPAVLVDCHSREIVDEFHEYCKPVLNPKLTDFCSTLTGITQDVVDSAEEFPAVLARMETWMMKHYLGVDHTFAVVTDGPWDMSRFLQMQCNFSKIPFPCWGKKWINIRKAYSTYYSCKRMNLEEMLINLGLKFEGTQHCGLHDSRNIARIAIQLLKDGCDLVKNEFLHVNQPSQGSRAQGNSIKKSPQDPLKSQEEMVKKLEEMKLESKHFVDENQDLLEYHRLQSS
uniref:3'-5' exoribonuclease 1 n=2 Tax=Crassostrea virginica TaxID=6565 RepID=A0A8B8ER69_CRAVI|nr:3'-5' exoribonuclease 1-like isoform X1 [Crassostrea virginica]